MTILELSQLPIGTAMIDDSDGDLGVICASRFFNAILWESGHCTTLNPEGKGAATTTTYRPNTVARS